MIDEAAIETLRRSAMKYGKKGSKTKHGTATKKAKGSIVSWEAKKRGPSGKNKGFGPC